MILCLMIATASDGCHGIGDHPARGTEAGQGGKASTVASPRGAADSRAPALPVPDLGYNAREGRVLFRHYCLTCHGEDGHGDGFNAYNLDPKPRDLADSAFQAKRSDDDLAAVIRLGGGVAGLSTGMPPWGRTLKDRKIHNLVDYLRTLPAASH